MSVGFLKNEYIGKGKRQDISLFLINFCAANKKGNKNI